MYDEGWLDRGLPARSACLSPRSLRTADRPSSPPRESLTVDSPERTCTAPASPSPAPRSPRDEQMVVVEGGDRVAGDPFGRERRGDRARKPTAARSECTVRVIQTARNVPVCRAARPPQPEHQRQPFGLAKRRQRRDPLGSEISGETAEEIDARLQLRSHLPQERLRSRLPLNRSLRARCRHRRRRAWPMA